MNRKNTPKLRFKEFEKADPWEQRKFVSVFDGLHPMMQKLISLRTHYCKMGTL